MPKLVQTEVLKDESVNVEEFDRRMTLRSFDQTMYVDGCASAELTLKQPSYQP
jgi:hypothetical protein